MLAQDSPRTGRFAAILAAGLAMWTLSVGGETRADDMSACDRCGCNGPLWQCSEPVPRDPWYVSTDGVALQRLFRGLGPVATLGVSPTGSLALSHEDMDAPFAPGVRMLIGHTFGDSPYQVEVSYFWLSSFDATAQATDPTGNLFSPFTHFGDPPDARVDNNSLIQIHELSQLESGEVNLKCVVPMPSGDPIFTFLFGVRHLGLREDFDYRSTPTTNANPVTVRSHTNNNLWGPQIGGLVDFGHTNAWFHIEGKFALCNNAIDRDLNANVDGTAVNHARSSLAGTAMIGDASASIRWRPTAALTAQFGYQVLWCDELALAARNFSSDPSLLTDPTAEPAINHRGTALYHGPFAGLQISW